MPPRSQVACLAVALQDHMSALLALPGARPPGSAPGAAPSLAQRLGLAPAPAALLTPEQWEAVHAGARARADPRVDACAVCLEPFADCATAQALLSCGHVFHAACLRAFEAHARSRACPLCRAPCYQTRAITDAADARAAAAATRIQAVARGWLARRALVAALVRQPRPPRAQRLRRLWAAGRLAAAAGAALAAGAGAGAGDLDGLFAELDASLGASRRLADPAAARAAAAAGSDGQAAGGCKPNAPAPRADRAGSAMLAALGQQRGASRRVAHALPALARLRAQRAGAAVQGVGLRPFSSSDGKDGKEKEAGFMQGILRSWTEKKGDGGADGKDAGSGVLVPHSPEHKHRKMFVVELGRKPLFPGIYTPVLVLKNERLIREVMDARKAGGQAYVAAFLAKPDKVLAEEAAARGDKPDGGAAGAGGEAGGGPSEQGGLERLYEVGTFAQVHTILAGDTADSAQLLLLGHRRLKRETLVSSDPLRVGVSHLRDEPYASDDITKATSMELVNTMKDLLNMNPLYGEQFRTLMSLTGSIDLNDLSRLVDAAASLTSADDVTLQGVLECLHVPTRAQMVLELLKKEVELCKLQADIREQVEAKIMKEQRRMILMEQLKSIKRELGLEKDDKASLIGNFQAKWEPKKAAAPEEVRKVVQDELDKLAGLEPVSPEFNVTRTYLEWLTCLPWGSTTTEIFDIPHAQQVLDAEHYGLQDVKARILEFIAVSRLRGSAQGKILCLVGPPGVGKTSIGRSIAATLGRKYFRFSVGGLADVAEIKGHRRTYVGAMPGKMVQCLKSTGSSNPLVLIDEIDKLGRGHTGDPASALLELLDPEQNSGFVDHYLDVPLDLSKVLFVCTANVLDTIPGPLLDRMEVIRLSGYTSDEKRAIARRYLEPQSQADSGVPGDAVEVTDGAMDVLIEEYAREAGVRNLKKQLEKIYRKAALTLVKQGAKLVAVDPPGAAGGADAGASSGSEQESGGEEAAAVGEAGSGSGSSGSGSGGSGGSGDAASSSGGSSSTAGGAAGGAAAARSAASSPAAAQIVLGPEGLQEYVGLPPFAADKFYDTATPVGVVMGLAWTAMGGATLYVEAAPIVEGGEGKGRLTTTGQLGDVMRESASIAHTYARAFLARRSPGSTYFNTTALHVHVPAGATPKDGPSAGCTIITALLSLALDTPVAPGLAMTGEVSLTGKVLPIGGVKEKLLAARRSGVTDVIFPLGNQREYEEVPADLKAGVTPHFVECYDQVFALAFPGLPPSAGAGAGAGQAPPQEQQQ
ncbi:lon protease [Scenedesmus sp. PABB004]|nr:lon protease [Scenedesmus sp. PABB004]